MSALRRRVVRETRELADDPVEALVLLRERLAERHELKAKRNHGGFMPWPPCPYVVTADWEQRIHELGGAWPCAAAADFWELWREVIARLEAKGYEVGRGAFAGWGDGEAALARAAYCLTVHTKPTHVVETGVARGITTRFVLEAMARNGHGHLWSIDLPPIGDTDVHDQTAAAVTDELRDRWTLVQGSSRRRLVPLFEQIGAVDLFVHDSRHTQRNVLFELDHARRALAPRGIMLIDDVDLNCGFHAYMAAHPGDLAMVCAAEPLKPDPGRQNDTGVFGIVVKGA